MKVFFSVCGIGLGHAGRSLIIAEKLKEMGNEVIFSSYGDAAEFIRRSGYDVFEEDELVWFEGKKGEVEVRNTLKNTHKYLATIFKHVYQESKHLLSVQPEIVVSDSRVSPIVAASMFDLPSITILHQVRLLLPQLPKKLEKKPYLKSLISRGLTNMLNYVWRQSEKILVPDFKEPYTIAKGHLEEVPKKSRKKIVFIGPLIGRRPEDYPAEDVLKREMGVSGKKVVYVAIGGTKREREAMYRSVIPVIKGLHSNYHFIVSKGEPSSTACYRLKENIVVHGWVRDRGELMKAADLIISRGGHNTVAEAMYFGKPLLVIPTPNHSEHCEISLNVKRMGIAEVCKQEKVGKELANLIEKMLREEDYARKCEQVAKDVSSYNPVTKTVEIIEETFSKAASSPLWPTMF